MRAHYITELNDMTKIKNLLRLVKGVPTLWPTALLFQQIAFGISILAIPLYQLLILFMKAVMAGRSDMSESAFLLTIVQERFQLTGVELCLEE